MQATNRRIVNTAIGGADETKDASWGKKIAITFFR